MSDLRGLVAAIGARSPGGVRTPAEPPPVPRLEDLPIGARSPGGASTPVEPPPAERAEDFGEAVRDKASEKRWSWRRRRR